jgi:hypothetical protein
VVKVGDHPYSVCVGDFNSDGLPDMAVANVLSNTVSVLLGDGVGGFATAGDYAVGTSPDSLDVGDFNGDGRADLAVTNAGTNTVSILLGSSGGGFAAHVGRAVVGTGVTITLGDSIAVADFNGDGKLDLATANHSSTTVSILLGNVDGTFTTPADYVVGSGSWQSWPSSVAVGDFNGDGKPDLAAANYTADTVSVLLNITEPVIGIMRINTGAAYNTTATVTLNSTISGATEMRCRDGGGTWSSWEAYAATRSWTLPTGDGVKTIEAEYHDAAATNTLSRSAHIFLDTTKPVTTDNAPATWRNHAVTVTLTPGDAGSGVAYTEYSLDSSAIWTTGTSVTILAPAGHYPDYAYTVLYRSADKADNSRRPRPARSRSTRASRRPRRPTRRALREVTRRT